MPYYIVLNYYNVVNCTSYYEKSYLERMSYGYFKFYLFDSNGIMNPYSVPYSCKQE